MDALEAMLRLSRTLATLRRPSIIEKLTQIGENASQLDSPSIRFMNQMQRAMDSGVFADPLPSLTAAARIARTFEEPVWLRALKRQNDLLAPFARLGISTADTSFSSMVRLAMVAEGCLASLDWSRAGTLLPVPASCQRGIVLKHARLSRTFSGVLEDVRSGGDVVERFVAPTAGAALEVVLAAETLTTISPTDRVFDDEDNALLEVLAEADDELESMLTSVRPDLMRMLHGARESLESDNPDRARHLIVSLRELTTQVIHALAPDDRVTKWISKPEKQLDEKGKPTRETRFAYITRSIATGNFAKFVEADVRAHVHLVRVLNEGTHSPGESLNERQCKVTLRRTEQMVRFLLEVSGGDDR